MERANEVVIKDLKEKILIEGNASNRIVESATLKKYQEKPKEAPESPDPRIDKTKRLLAECYKQHIASLQKITAPMKFIPKEWLLGLSIACGIICLFSVFWARYVPLYLLNVNLERSSRLPILFLTISLVIVFGFGYYALSRLASNLADIDRLEKSAVQLMAS